ncbi:MAG: dialkylresorcinol condensing enzyme [Opitutaceae bacterium]|nr:dialkylresorcinol condensing enzyme [Opitutaceae bacterium]
MLARREAHSLPVLKNSPNSQPSAFPANPGATPPPVRAGRVLVVQYSQTGQQIAALDALLAPLLEAGAASGISVHRETLRTIPAYPYPWPFWKFLDTFPETVAGDAPPLEPLTVPPGAEFDLVIIAYPVWFLSPPPALTAFLRGDDARRLLRDRPVITLTACRNMWLMAQEKTKALLRDAGARHCDHIALTDQGSALASFITTPRWLLTGRKNAFWGLPAAGVSARDISGCARFGRAILSALRQAGEKNAGATAPQPACAPLLAGLRACAVDGKLIASERIGIRNFRFWAKILRACGPQGAPLRRAMLLVFTGLFFALIVTVVPASFILKTLLAPLLRKKLARAAALYEQPSGSGGGRLALFS